MSYGETCFARLRKYERREQLTIWVAAGLGSLVAFAATDVIKEAPRIFPRLVLTIAALGGLCLAFSRVQFEWNATIIRRQIDEGTIEKTTLLPPELGPWPRVAENLWNAALMAIALGWLVLLVGIWWPSKSSAAPSAKSPVESPQLPLPTNSPPSSSAK